MNWYIITIADYVGAPSVLFCGNTTGYARKNIAETKLLVRCTATKGICCMTWLTGSEPVYTNEEIKAEMQTAAWREEE